MNFFDKLFGRNINKTSNTRQGFNPENELMMECPPYSGQAICSDDACPCDNTKMPPATGYLLIRQEVVSTRRNCLTMSEMQNHMSKSGVSAIDFNSIRRKYLPIAVCEQSARMRKLNLSIAKSDFDSWVSSGKVPCRETPLNL